MFPHDDVHFIVATFVKCFVGLSFLFLFVSRPRSRKDAILLVGAAVGCLIPLLLNYLEVIKIDPEDPIWGTRLGFNMDFG